VAAAAWLLRRTAPHLLVGAMLFVIGALPVLGFLPFEFQGYSTVADHYLYLSMLGPALALAWVAQRFGSRRYVAAALVLVLALFWVRTMLLTRHWRDDETLWTHNLDVNPRSFLAYTNLGFWNDFHRRPARAIEMYREAVKLDDEYVNATAMYNLANGLLRAGEYEDAITWYRKLIDVSMTVPPEARVVAPLDAAYVSMGRALAKLGRKAEAANAFRKTLELNPDHKAAAEALKSL
jgi:protein O-mannosyl-transferase